MQRHRQERDGLSKGAIVSDALEFITRNHCVMKLTDDARLQIAERLGDMIELKKGVPYLRSIRGEKCIETQASLGMYAAYRAIALLKRIPRNDPQRTRAMATVSQWIFHATD